MDTRRRRQFNHAVNVLIIGGTGLISTGIVKALQERGAAITVFNRGRTDDRLGTGVRHLAGDRKDFPAFEAAMAAAGPWDVVIDMICFRPDEAESDVRAFAGRCGHFICCSTVCTVVMSLSAMPRVFATSALPGAGSVLVDHISSLPPFQCAVAPCGSSVMCARKGHW